MKTANRILYGIFGTVALLYAVITLAAPDLLEREAGQSARFAHLMREQGAAGIFIGLMAFWCIANYERRKSVHYFLTAFAFLIGAIHWFDYFAGNIGWLSPIYNSVPFAVLLIMAVASRELVRGAEAR